jgi:simple sugar transport system ATP-binding protein
MSSELSIIFISHKLQEVKDLSDKITILRHGAVVFEGNTHEHSPSDIAALMTGHEVDLPLNEEPAPEGVPVLDIKNLNVKSDRGFLALKDLNLTISSGEIVGLAGVSGNGQRELAEAINGLRKVESGEIQFYGENIANKSPHHIIEAGMGYIPEERNTEGIVPSFSLKENLILKDTEHDEFSNHAFLKNKAIDKNAEDLRVKFDIRSPNISIAAGSLSGGNIQKVILAREISRRPKFLIAVYPIRGLDLGAAEFIHKQLLEIRREGIGILLISEELDEILDLSDRVAVIFKGQIQKVLDRKDANRRSLGILMAGVKDDQTV